MSYAGFWKRVAALIVDMIVMWIAGLAAGVSLGLIMGLSGITNIGIISVAGNLLGLLLGWIYYAAMESSATQGTLGKMAVGIKVTDLEGNRIGFGRATGRFFGRMISSIILLIGYIMVAFTEKKQSLHDIMAGCLVVNRA